MYIYIFISINMSTYIFMHMSAYVYISLYVYTYMYARAYTYKYIFMYICYIFSEIGNGRNCSRIHRLVSFIHTNCMKRHESTCTHTRVITWQMQVVIVVFAPSHRLLAHSCCSAWCDFCVSMCVSASMCERKCMHMIWLLFV